MIQFPLIPKSFFLAPMLIDNEEQTRRSGQADITLVLIGHRRKFERRMYCQVRRKHLTHPNQHTPTAIPTTQPFFLLLTSQIPHLPAIPHNGRPIPPSPYASHLSPLYQPLLLKYNTKSTPPTTSIPFHVPSRSRRFLPKTSKCAVAI